ncbi:mediator of RNA polymerase II transcription subunit 12 [[Candida] railenensis]|uniref:Mediator of RNA polymerase II transcription subunit 12 n=1 Tax=[Candida] railenensis TaxID=45579 RepID=A0A9P0QNI8_9ASCO|nr:mediator of RNA polymerase II transcription subunit 12 [[Candida] railenensis]
MSKRSKNSLLTPSNNRNTHQTAVIKDELLSMKYTMTGPGSSIYPYDDYNASNATSGGANLESDSAVLEDDDSGKFRSKGRTTLIRRSSKSKPSPGNGGVGSGSDDASFNLITNNPDGSVFTYPDYKPWSDHTSLSSSDSKLENEKITNNAYLNKGYFEPPSVSNEYYSARNMIQNTIFSSTSNCQRVLNDLSNQLSSAYSLRNDQVNRIKFESNTFKLPPRVTLTASKKEIWLRDLANPQIPLSQLSTKIPHGVRNKILIDSLCAKFVPLPRAIWFTKCVLHSELLAWRKKISLRQQQLLSSSSGTGAGGAISIPSIQTLENQWLQEWTQQMVEYIQKYSREMTNIVSQERKHIYTQKLTYLLSYAQTLYIESLLEKSTFLSLSIKFFIEGIPQQIFFEGENGDEEEDDDSSDAEREEVKSESRPDDTHFDQQQQHDLHMSINYGQRLVALTIVKTYWNDILKLDYLCKELSESLLINYYLISKTSTKKRQQGIQHHHQQHQHHNSQSQYNIGSVSNFMSASSPMGLMGSPMYSNSPSVYAANTPTSNPHNHQSSAVNNASSVNATSSFSVEFKNKLLKTIAETITFLVKFNSNIFIIPNYWPIVGGTLRSILEASPVTCDEERDEMNKQYTIIKYRNESLMLNLSDPNSAPVPTPTAPPETPSAIISKNTVETYSKRRSSKDILNIIYQLDNLKLNEQLAVFLRPSSGNVGGVSWQQHLKLVLYWCVTSYRKSRSTSDSILTVCNFLKKIVFSKIESNRKMEFESEILQVIYDIAEESENDVVPNKLYILLNELYQLKLLTISSYLRKLIASGIFYVETNINVEDRRIINSHINILKNLPVLNNKQCDSILKKWTIEGYDFNEKFEEGKTIVSNQILSLLSQQQQQQNDENLEIIKNLAVGVKFLLVNWTTSQVKSMIANSPKLVHMTPAILSRLFEFYSVCDSLTVFFKVILRFILRNDGMVIIYYMDTLRLITRLILKHSKLVMLVDTSDNNELFRLVLTSYKDLIMREPDFFNFREFWKYMSHLVERSNLNNSEYSNGQVNEGAFDNDTTMNLVGNLYGSAITDDLEELLTFSRKPLEQAEISEIVTNLSLNVEPNDERKLLSKLHEFNSKSTDDVEIGIVRLLVNLKDMDKDTFFSILREFLQANSDFGMNFFQKLINYDIIDMPTLAGIHPSILINSESASLSESVNPDQALVWNFAAEQYLTRNSPYSLKMILSGDDIQTNSKYLELLTIKHTPFIIEELIKKHPLNVVLSHYEKVLGIELQNKSTEEIIELIAVLVNEFNLSICQVILKALPIEDYRTVNFMIDAVFQHLHLKFSPHNSYFGDLFDLLDWQVKSKILDYLENLFLTETKFDEENKITLKSVNNVNLLPVLKDFFKKFTIRSSAGINTSSLLLELSISFTSKLLLVTERTEIEQYDSDLYNTLCVFLRILIIHKQPLMTIIIQHDEKLVLVQKLIELLNSSYFAGSKCEKLKILLYDLLLILKGGISEILTENNTNSEISGITSGSMGSNITTSAGAGVTQLSPNEGTTGRRNSGGSPNTTAMPTSSTIANPSFVQEVFHLPEPTHTNPLERYIGSDNVKCLLTLDEKELTSDAEINYVNGDALEIVSVVEGSEGQAQRAAQSGMHMKSFELLEGNGSGINGSCINLSLFQAYTTRQNPP